MKKLFALLQKGAKLQFGLTSSFFVLCHSSLFRRSFVVCRSFLLHSFVFRHFVFCCSYVLHYSLAHGPCCFMLWCCSMLHYCYVFHRSMPHHSFVIHHSFVFRYSFAQVPFAPCCFTTLLCFLVPLCYAAPLPKSIFPPFSFLQCVRNSTFNFGVWHEAWKHQVPSWWKQ